MSKVMYKGNPIQKGGSAASEVLFDKSAVSNLGIEATNVQDLIDYLLKLAGNLTTELDDKFIVRLNMPTTSALDGYSTQVQKSALNLKNGVKLSDYKWLATPVGGDTDQYFEWDHIATKATAEDKDGAIYIRSWMFVEQSSSEKGNMVKLVKNLNINYDIVGIKVS